jgi:hypothetical protein
VAQWINILAETAFERLVENVGHFVFKVLRGNYDMSAFYRRGDLTERIEKLFALVDHCVDLAACAA